MDSINRRWQFGQRMSHPLTSPVQDGSTYPADILAFTGRQILFYINDSGTFDVNKLFTKIFGCGLGKIEILNSNILANFLQMSLSKLNSKDLGRRFSGFKAALTLQSPSA